MVVGRVMGTGTGKHIISMKLAQGSADNLRILCGVVRDGAPCNADHGEQESTVGWFMSICNGGLNGNGKVCDDVVGEIEPGQV